MRKEAYRTVSYRLGGFLILMGLILGGGGCTDPKELPSEEISKAPPDTANAEKPSDYHFQLKYEDMWGVTTLSINGFPVHQSGGGHITDNPVLSIGLNTGLVGDSNRVSLRVEPMILGGRNLSIGPVQMHGRVTRDYEGKFGVKGAKITEVQVDSVYERWSKRAQKKWETYRSTVERGALDSMRAWASRHPMTVSATFDNEVGPDFSRIFEQVPRLPDTPATRRRLKDYAMHLRDLFVQGDTVRLYREHKLSFQSNDSSKEKALNIIGTNWLTYDWHTDFEREDLTCRRWSDGRVWEIYRDDELSNRLSKQALFLAGEDRLAGWHKVYVAEIDGELKVVR